MLTADGSTGSRFSSPVISEKVTRYWYYITIIRFVLCLKKVYSLDSADNLLAKWDL